MGQVARGQCVLPVDDSGRVLDRLAGLEKVIPPAAIRQALAASGQARTRACVLTPEVMCWVVLAMGLLTDLPLRQVFKHARRLRPDEPTPTRAALCAARRRLGLRPLLALARAVVRPLATEQTAGAFYHGLRRMGIDGTVLDVPDSPANARAFGRPSGGDRGPGAFPQVRKLSLVEPGTHVAVALVAKRLACGEPSMVDGLLRHLGPGMLLLWDRGFFSYRLWQRVTATGARLLARAGKHLVLRPLQELADGSYLAKIYPSPAHRRRDEDGLLVRVIRYTLDDPRRVGHGEEHVLLTDLLAAATYPARELIVEYHQRWEEELVFDEQQTHQDPPRPTKPTHLRSQTPAGVLQELYALSLGHYGVRAVMHAAAVGAAVDPDRLSFTGALQILRCRLPECDSRAPAALDRWYQALLGEILQERLGPRRNRINPRVIKRKMSKWKKARPEHRRLPPFPKTFVESIVMLR
jgi:hypothetical protein